jgi:Rrf2 family protein
MRFVQEKSGDMFNKERNLLQSKPNRPLLQEKSPMKLTRAGSYGLRAVSYLARRPEDKPFASHDIARECGIPERFLLKCLKPLADRGILRSMKGPNGGYRLGMPASKITLTQVLEAVEGPLNFTIPQAAEKMPAAEQQLDRRLQHIWDEIAADTRQRLDRTHISDLAGGNPDRPASKRGPRPHSGARGKARNK